MTRVVVGAYRVASLARAAGHFWVYAQYAHALRRLGCDVWWLEELPAGGGAVTDQDRTATLRDRLRPFGLADRVVLYRWEDDAAEPTYLTVPAVQARRTLEGADLLLNFDYRMRNALLERFRRTALVDIDPGLLQLWWHHGDLRVNRHDVYFSIGENLDGTLPGVAWTHSPPAVSLDLWPYHFDPAARAFTSVTSWSSRAYVTLLDGSTIDTNKRLTYLEFGDLPRRTRQHLELATVLGPGEDADRGLMEARGWTMRSAAEVAGTPGGYRDYIQRSRGELGLAKPAYVLLGNAWLSDRTVCYLATGKPAVVQDTGASSYLPVGRGLLRFSSVDEAVAALAEVDADYAGHCRDARELAETYFSATDVVTRMLSHALGA
ncbi:MAG TPA: hypothetical protein VFR87_14470 [Nocardioidaceae bacterium]|nr:hypothetical protein [Nocardioidaceae bacterium]